MDIYHVWCDIEGDITDKEWAHNLREFLKSLKFHLLSPKYFRQPTIDLTCCCKNDLETKVISIVFLFFFIFASFKVIVGFAAEQEDDR